MELKTFPEITDGYFRIPQTYSPMIPITLKFEATLRYGLKLAVGQISLQKHTTRSRLNERVGTLVIRNITFFFDESIRSK